MLEKVQDLENAGYHFEAAEASFELLVRKEIGRYRKFFELDHYRVSVLKKPDGEPVSEATVKLHVNGQLEHHVAEGDGPVNALDKALRKSLIGPLSGDRPGPSDRLQGAGDQFQGRDRRAGAGHHRMPPGLRRRRAGRSSAHRRQRQYHRRELAGSVDAYEYHLIHVAEGETA